MHFLLASVLLVDLVIISKANSFILLNILCIECRDNKKQRDSYSMFPTWLYPKEARSFIIPIAQARCPRVCYPCVRDSYSMCNCIHSNSYDSMLLDDGCNPIDREQMNERLIHRLSSYKYNLSKWRSIIIIQLDRAWFLSSRYNYRSVSYLYPNVLYPDDPILISKAVLW